jgi:branched-chain amino acid transport system substrate-binding protein
MSGSIWGRRGVLALVIALVAALAACGDDDRTAGPGDNGAPDLPDEITIGLTVPETGAFSLFGRFYYDAFRLWEQDINDAGGLLGSRVRLEILDDQSDAGTASRLYTRLITVDNVDLVIGGFPTPTLVPVLEIADRNGMVLIQGGHNAAPLIRGEDLEYVFTTITPSDLYSLSFIEWLESLPEDERPANVAIVEQVNPFFQDVMDTVRPHFEELGIEIVADERFSDDAQDFTSIVQRLQGQGVEFVFFGNNLPASFSFIRTMAEQGYRPDLIYSTVGPTLPEWVSDLGAATNYVFSSAPYWHTFDTPGNAEFVQRIEEEYGYVATRESGMAFTVLQVLQQAVEATGSVDQDVLRDYLRDNEFQTVMGTFRFDDDQMIDIGSAVLQVQGDDRFLVWPPDAQEEEPVYPRP